MSDEDKFAKTQYYGFFKPAIGSLHWSKLSEVNWDMADALFARQAEVIAAQDRTIAYLQVTISSLQDKLFPNPEED